MIPVYCPYSMQEPGEPRMRGDDPELIWHTYHVGR